MEGVFMKAKTYQEKFSLLSPWFESLVASIKKDLKEEPLKKDRIIYAQLFGNKLLKNLSSKEMWAAYAQALAQGHESLGEYLAARWILRHRNIYDFFEARLRTICQNFDELGELQASFAKDLIEDAVANFGAVDTYCFSVLNDVTFSAKDFEELRKKAFSLPSKPQAKTPKEVGVGR